MRLGDDEVTVRLMEPSDRNYILSTWLRSARDLTKARKDRFFELVRPQVEADLEHGVVLVACAEDEPGAILGWACYRDCLRWAYVDFALRNNGIFTFLRDSYEQAEQEAIAA